eukprot:COSAG02_NODE_2392_length_8974_cov_2.135437_1_plen_197_part_00
MLRGTALGKRLQTWSNAKKRPLIWDGLSDNFFIDPTVNGINGGNITASDMVLFERYWSQPNGLTSWIAQARPHLRLYLPSWFTRHACAENEAKGENVIGVSGDGQCVSYTPDPKPSSWERANDGTCETSTDPVRELFVLALFRHVSKSSVKLKRVVDQRVLEFGQVRAKWATQKACESSSKRDGFVCVQSPTQGRE